MIPRAETLAHFAALTDPSRRRETARALAQHLGAEDLIIFLPDPEVGVLLPAPGFVQTLPRGRQWRVFLAECLAAGQHTDRLPFPDATSFRRCTGLSFEGAVLVLLDGAPNLDEAASLAPLVSIITALFCNERAAAIIAGRAALARATATEAAALARTLSTTQRDLQRALSEAREALALRDQFLSSAAHELRTPLTPLKGSLQIARRQLARGTPPAELDLMLGRAEHQVDRLARLVASLLDVSRLASGQFERTRETVSLVALVTRVAEAVQLTEPARPVEVFASEPDAFVRGDAMGLEQVLVNLVENARKYSPAASPIELRITADAQTVTVAVRDQGIGIPHDEQARIFERLHRAGNVGASVSGFGLGLHIAREIVAAHGGTLTVESTPGAGSTFRMTLPRIATGNAS